jgi:16S rRNA C967 or C1407 C5-methylase (RsmB/RsmF family)
MWKRRSDQLPARFQAHLDFSSAPGSKIAHLAAKYRIWQQNCASDSKKAHF